MTEIIFKNLLSLIMIRVKILGYYYNKFITK